MRLNKIKGYMTGTRIRRKSWHPFCFIHYDKEKEVFMWGDIQNWATDGKPEEWRLLVSDLIESDWELFKIPNRQKLAAYEKRNKVPSGTYQHFKILPQYEGE